MTTTITILIDGDQGTLVAKAGGAGLVRSFAVDASTPPGDDAEATVAAELGVAFAQLRALQANPPTTAPAPKPATPPAAKKPAAGKQAVAPARPAAGATGDPASLAQVDLFAF